MAYELKDGQGSLFKNDRKTNDKGPDYKGQIKVDGVEYWLAAWIKEGQKGKWMSLSVVPKDAERAPSKRPLKSAIADDEDSIPF